MEIIDCPQRSEEWFQARLGKPTASNFDKIVTTAGKPSKQACGYMYELAGQRITGQIEKGYSNAIIERGAEMEDEARNMFQLITDIEIEQVGLIMKDNKKYSCSPDGINFEQRFGLEIKCPIMKTQVKALNEDKLPDTFNFQQVQGSMIVTEFTCWYFFSYYPGLPPILKKIARDSAFCALLKKELDIFCENLDNVTQKLTQIKKR